MKNKKYFILSLVVIIAILMTACSPQEATNNEEEVEDIIENYEPADGGTLKVSVTRFNTLNPLFNNNYSLFQLHHLIYEGLVTFDTNMDIQPLLAEKWNVAADGQSIQFHLRKGVTWHDGEPFTAEDVIFTTNLIKGNIKNVSSNSVFRTSLQQISDIREVEEGVINITFSRPFSNGLEVMTFPILPKHLFEGNNVSRLTDMDFPMIGTGAFQLSDYETMRNIKLGRNENYWGQKPYIKEVDAVIVPDVESQLSVFENGDIDLAQPTSIDWAKYAKNKNVKVYEYVSRNYEFVGFNFKNSILKDKNVRKAIAYGVDRHKLINNIYLGHGTVVDVPVYPLTSIYEEDSLQYGYNVDEAVELLEKSGYLSEGDHATRVNEEGTSLNFNLIANKDNVLREKAAFFIQEELERIGIQIDVELLEWEEFNDRVSKGSFDMILGGWDLSYIPDLSFAFHSTQMGGSNFISYYDETIDELLEEAFRAPSRTEKEKSYSQLQKHIAEELPYFSLFFKNGSIVVRDKVKGEIKPNNYNLFNGIEDWFINTK
ncbi:peptide/nickel transport system substrate-binding protein [Anaerovirgula multivorans]|uniref:Peptide/nickel transport system substrate-binding protein n=1 Tax=Anaerovirgula multivorans TaxID=312168 RepID=A0A239HVF4_9FIRM|nr:peptide ABC transporter substrate-binding protein [Anaerovirgula multivorans]SNS85108.1 peptide/nickel transport system substrate-binding protein [Anaerovirgula multivorans]